MCGICKYKYSNMYNICVLVFIYIYVICLGYKFLHHFWPENSSFPSNLTNLGLSFKVWYSCLANLKWRFYAKASATENAGIGESSSETRLSITAGTKKDQLFSLDKNPLDVFRTPWWDTTKKPSALNLQKPSENTSELNWLVLSTHLNNISQFGSFPQVGVEIKNVWNHHLVNLAKPTRIGSPAIWRAKQCRLRRQVVRGPVGGFFSPFSRRIHPHEKLWNYIYMARSFFLILCQCLPQTKFFCLILIHLER